MPNPEESFTKIGVPEDGSCLFWAVTLAYLTPVKNDDALFRQRYETLFGNEETATQNLNHIRNLVQNYNTYDNTFVGLVRNTFRNRVADHIRSNENELRAFVEGESGRSFDDYLQNMRNPNTWGGEPEIRAMSEMLGADISVSGASNTRYANGDVQIQLFHVGTLGVRNHYNFGLEQHIVNDNEVGRLQNSLKESIKHYQGGPQDFELIQLLIQETDSSKASTSTQQRKDFESFQARFQSYIDQIPSYLHSVKKPGFFSHFFFGSFSVLLDTEIAEKLNIKKIYFSFANSKTLKVVVIKNGQIGNGEDAINNINLFSISEGELGHQFTPDELEKILRENIDKSKIKDQDVENKIQNIKNEIQGEIESRLVQIFKEKDGIFVNMEVKKILDSAAGQEFHEIKKGLWNNPEGDIAGLTGSDKTIVERSLERILGEVSKVHSKYEKSLQYGSKAREAAHHGFVAGALNNFRYRHNLRVYLEQFAERGYADIVLLPRGPNRALDSIPIIIELKAGKGPNLTPDKALEQAEKYAQGFQPNVQRVLTTSDDILCVGVNLDYPSPISNIKAPSRKTKIVPFLQDMLESTDEWNKNDIDKRILKTRILDNMERIYHTFPGTGEKGDNHYFSRFLLGQSLLLNEVLGIGFEKHIFIYKENISTETHPKPSKPQRPVAQKAKDELSKGLDKSHAIVSMVLIPESTEKLVYVINIVEANRKDVLEKVLPLDRLNQKIGDREIVELDLNFDTRYKSNFQKYLTVKASDPVFLEQYSHRVIDEFQGTFREVPYPDQLKETFDRALDSQLTSAQSSSINEYNELFKKIGEGIWSFKALINNEPHLQGVLNGVSSYYSDLKLQESPEARALVLTEFQTGRGERIDMLVHGIKFEGDDKNAKEYTPIGLELKASRQGKGAQALLKEANDQINKEYKKGVTYKTLTDGDEVKFIGVVFDKGAKKADSLILTSEKSIPVKVVHSSTLVLPTVGQCSKEREKRNIDMACVDSRDEEDITKEEKERRIKELLSDQMMMKIKLKKLESEISDEVLSRHEEIESVATYDVNKSDVLSNALQSLKLSKMLLLMSQKSEVSTELQEKAYYNALTDLGALIHDHKNHVHGDHLSALESRVHGNQLFSVAHDLYYLSKSEGNVDQDKLYSDQVKSKISSYVEGENGLDDIYSEFNIIDIKGYFSDSDIKDFYAEAEAYDKEVITIHSTQVFADGVEVYVEVKDSNGDYQKVVIGDVASIQNTENYILDEETSEIKLRIDDDKEYTTTQELEEGHVKHYLSILGGYKVKVGNIISSFAENIKKAIHSKLHSLELSASKKDVEEISNAEITDRNYDNVVGEIKQNLLQKGVSEGTFNQLKDHLDSLGKKVFAEYISDVEKKLEGHEIEFDRSKFALAKANMSKGGKFFFLMAIYDLFDSINDVPTLGRHDNDALKKIFGINGILDAMDDVRESLSASYIRSDGKAVTKIPRDSAIGKVISKIPDSTRKTFVKIINNPVVQSITFATIAYQFGYSINEIVKGNHHPLNYYWTASSGIKLASMSIKPISVGVSSAMKGISSATKILRGLSTASKVLGKVAVVTMVADVFITIGVEIHERMEYTKAIAEQVPLLPGNEQAVVFFNWKDAGQRYEGIIRVKGYLNYIKDRAVHLLSAYNIAAVVQHVANIKEGYFITFDINTRNWEKRYLNISFDSIGMNFGTWVNLSSLDISKTLPMTLHALVMDEGWERFKCEFAFSARLECHRKINEKVVYIVNTDAKHVPHLTKCEYENLGLRIVSAPLECQVRKPQCDPQSAAAKDSAISKARRFMVNYNNEAYTDCTNTFTLSSEPFIFTKTTIGSSSPILYLLGPNRLTAAKNYPAVMVVPEGGVDYRGSTDHDNVFIINYDTYGHLIGGTKSNNTVVMNYNASTISVALHQYGTIRVEDSVIGLLNIPNYISHSTANQNITTGCKTRRVDAGEGGGNNSIQHYDVHCQDEDYEIRKVNKKDTHFRSAKQTTFIVDKNSGNGASIISSNNLESKKNLDTILIKNIDIAQLKINEHQADYSLELLTDDKRSTVTSTKIDSFENLVIQVEHYGIRKTITVQDKSLFDIIKDMEYQKLNHSGTGVSNKIIENSKKRSKAVILTDITVSEGLTAYGVAKDIINNNNLDIPISLVQVKKITGDVAHEAVVESMYSGEIVADFSHGAPRCAKVRQGAPRCAKVRQEVLGEQLVKIQHKQSLANSLEQTTMLHEVTSVIELVGWTMQGTTEVKEWSPEIPEDIEVDMFMAMEDSMKDNVKASYHSLYRDLRPCHVLKWTSSELGRSHAFLLRYVGTSQQRQELEEDAGEVGLIDSTQNVGKPRTRGSDQQYSNWNRDCYANTTEVGITCDIN